MNANTQAHPQGQFQGPMSGQQQNSGQPRGQYPPQNATKQPGLQGSQGKTSLGQPIPTNPQSSLWIIEKPLNAESWDTADPQEQYVSAQDVQERIIRFRRQNEDIADILLNLKSQSARRAVNKLVKVENDRLWQHNPTLQYAIVSVKLDKEMIKHWPDKGKKRLRRIDVILQTEDRPTVNIPKSYLDSKANKMGQDSYGVAGQGGAQNQKGNQSQGPGGGQGQNPNTQQQQPQTRPQQQGQFQGQGHGQQQHNQGHGQQSVQYGQQLGQSQGRPPQGPGGPPPPPPPPPHGQGPPGNGPQAVMPPPPPPPPHMQPQPQHNQPQVARPQQMTQQQAYQVPGAYPAMAHQPRMPPPIEVLDPRLLDAQKAKHRGHRRDFRDESQSDSDSDISSLSSRSVEDGAYGYIERSRSRGRKHNSHRRNRSRSSPRHRSCSRGGIIKTYPELRSHGRTRPDTDPQPRDRFGAAGVSTSPHPPNGALPSQNIFNIRIDNDNERANAKKGRDGHNRAHNPRRSSHSISPTGFPSPTFRKQDKYTAEPMFRGGSNNGSDTDSSFAGSSSIYSASDGSVFSEPERMHMKTAQMPMRSHMPRPRDDGFVQPPYTDYERRRKANYAGPNDYPPHRARARSPFYDDHIIQPVRRHSGQQNPFDPRTRYPEQHYAQQQRYITEKEHDMLNMSDLADFVDQFKQQQHRHSKGGRRGSVRVPPGSLGIGADADEWANSNRASRYENVHPKYSGYRHVY